MSKVKVKPSKWTMPQGKTIEAVVRDATRQVIRNYGEALRRLAR